MTPRFSFLPKYMISTATTVMTAIMTAIMTMIMTITMIVAPMERAMGALNIPKQLGPGDREEVLKIIAFGTASKVLSDPYPLGGYSGLEFGLSLENFPTSDLSSLGGAPTAVQHDITFSKFTLGKGLYNNVDVFAHFSPYTKSDEISQFGGSVRWGFYLNQEKSFSLSSIVHINSINIGNQVTSRSYGLDFVAGLSVDNLGVYCGAGAIRADGTFTGGLDGVTASQKSELASVSGLHALFGLSYSYLNYFFVGEVDRYSVTVLSGKLGLRF